MEPVVVDEFEDEMIGYEEDYKYREDIMKPNQAIDPRRQVKQQHTNHDRFNKTIVQSSRIQSDSVNDNHEQFILTPNTQHSLSFDSNYQFDRSESQYAGLVESQL